MPLQHLRRVHVALLVFGLEDLHAVQGEVLVVQEGELLEAREVAGEVLPRHGERRRPDGEPLHLRHRIDVCQRVVDLAKVLGPDIELQGFDVRTVAVEERQDGMLSLRRVASTNDLQRLQLWQHEVRQHKRHGTVLEAEDLEPLETLEAAAKLPAEADERRKLHASAVIAIAGVHKGHSSQLREEVPDHVGSESPPVAVPAPRVELRQAEAEGVGLVEQHAAEGASIPVPHARPGPVGDARRIVECALGRPSHLGLRAQRPEEALKSRRLWHQALGGRAAPAKPPSKLARRLHSHVHVDGIPEPQHRRGRAAILLDVQTACCRGPVKLHLPQLPLCLGGSAEVVSLQGVVDLVVKPVDGLFHGLCCRPLHHRRPNLAPPVSPGTPRPAALFGATGLSPCSGLRCTEQTPCGEGCCCGEGGRRSRSEGRSRR
mmetsp:Transcript_46936/g.119040  ORF Transcript_46936/g.119040 Transcript_46936/m.119040 type:complete len:431 (-) Transcript_46936:225-1517(-)